MDTKKLTYEDVAHAMDDVQNRIAGLQKRNDIGFWYPGAMHMASAACLILGIEVPEERITALNKFLPVK